MSAQRCTRTCKPRNGPALNTVRIQVSWLVCPGQERSVGYAQLEAVSWDSPVTGRQLTMARYSHTRRGRRRDTRCDPPSIPVFAGCFSWGVLHHSSTFCSRWVPCMGPGVREASRGLISSRSAFPPKFPLTKYTSCHGGIYGGSAQHNSMEGYIDVLDDSTETTIDDGTSMERPVALVQQDATVQSSMLGAHLLVDAAFESMLGIYDILNFRLCAKACVQACSLMKLEHLYGEQVRQLYDTSLPAVMRFFSRAFPLSNALSICVDGWTRFELSLLHDTPRIGRLHATDADIVTLLSPYLGPSIRELRIVCSEFFPLPSHAFKNLTSCHTLYLSAAGEAQPFMIPDLPQPSLRSFGLTNWRALRGAHPRYLSLVLAAVAHQLTELVLVNVEDTIDVTPLHHLTRLVIHCGHFDTGGRRPGAHPAVQGTHLYTGRASSSGASTHLSPVQRANQHTLGWSWPILGLSSLPHTPLQHLDLRMPSGTCLDLPPLYALPSLRTCTLHHTGVDASHLVLGQLSTALAKLHVLESGSESAVPRRAGALRLKARHLPLFGHVADLSLRPGPVDPVAATHVAGWTGVQRLDVATWHIAEGEEAAVLACMPRLGCLTHRPGQLTRGAQCLPAGLATHVDTVSPSFHI